MDLLSKELLILVKEAGFPQSKLADGQVWYDTISELHGIIIGNTLFYFGGGFTAISERIIPHAGFLLQPTVQDFMHFMPSNVYIEKWSAQFSVKIDDDEKPKRFSSANPIEAMAKAYIYLTLGLDDVTTSLTFTRTWKDASTSPPDQSDRYWCIVEEQGELGKSTYQWNCFYNSIEKTWSDYGQSYHVTFWTELPPLVVHTAT